MSIRLFFFISGTLFVTACNTSVNKKQEIVHDTIKTATKDTVTKKDSILPERPAIINIIDTLSPKRTVIYIKDSAKTFDRIALKLKNIYTLKLVNVFKKYGVKSVGLPMAWYKTDKPPYFFEAGIPVDYAPAILPDGIFVREMKNDSVVIAHFFGPHHLLPQGYTALKEWLVDTKKISTSAPYEIYIDNLEDKITGNLIESSKLRTDIVFPRK